MSWIGSVVGGVLGAQGANEQAQFKEFQGEFLAQVGEKEADFQVNKAAFEERQLRKDVSRVLAEDVAIQGKQGVAVGSGSNLDRLFQNIEDSELDALTIRHGGAVAAQRLREQAVLDRFAGEQGAEAIRIQGTSTAVGTAFNVGSRFNRNSGSRTLPGDRLDGPTTTNEGVRVA